MGHLYLVVLMAALEKKNTYDPELSDVVLTRTDIVPSVISNVRVIFLYSH